MTTTAPTTTTTATTRTTTTTTAATALVAAMLMLAAPARAGAQDRPGWAGERRVTTSGQAEQSLAPDQAWITVGIEQRALKSQEAQRLAAQVMTRIQSQLAGLGIPEGAIRTVSFNLHADWQYAAGKRTLRGYIVTNMVQVRVDDITKVADVLDRSIAAGGNAIHGVRWDLKDRVQVERDTLRQAVEDAKQRAEVAVAAAGGKLGAVASINEQRMGGARQMEMAMRDAVAVGAVAEAQSSTPISPGELTVRSMVTVSFRIE